MATNKEKAAGSCMILAGLALLVFCIGLLTSRVSDSDGGQMLFWKLWEDVLVGGQNALGVWMLLSAFFIALCIIGCLIIMGIIIARGR